MTERIDAAGLQVVRGSVTADELAAIVVVVNAAAQRSRQSAVRSRPEWNAAHRGVRAALSHGSGAWRRSALPR